MKRIKAIMVYPQKKPKTVWLKNTTLAFNKAVSIDANFPCEAKFEHIEKNIFVMYAAESRAMEFPINRMVGRMLISGVFYIIASDGHHHPTSLTDEEIQTYKTRFEKPARIPTEEEIYLCLKDVFEIVEKMQIPKI